MAKAVALCVTYACSCETEMCLVICVPHCAADVRNGGLRVAVLILTLYCDFGMSLFW